MVDNLEPNDPMDEEYLDPEEEMIARDTHEPVVQRKDRKPEDVKDESQGEEPYPTNVEEIYPGGAPHAAKPEDMNESGQNDQDQSEGTYGPV